MTRSIVNESHSTYGNMYTKFWLGLMQNDFWKDYILFVFYSVASMEYLLHHEDKFYATTLDYVLIL